MRKMFCLAALCILCSGCAVFSKAQVVSKEESLLRVPLIGEEAPAFEADTTQGHIKFPDDYKGKWVIFFSHPSDFTPVCTTEFMTLAAMQDELKKLDTVLLGLSVDSISSHIAWLRTIRDKIEYRGMKNVDVKFPVIANPTMAVARRYGMVQPAASETTAVRGVFFIDPDGKVRAYLYYPLTNGRNMDELKRLLLALQCTQKSKLATPANWQPGDDVIIPPPNTMEGADARLQKQDEEYHCLDWFMCFRKCPVK